VNKTAARDAQLAKCILLNAYSRATEALSCASIKTSCILLNNLI